MTDEVKDVDVQQNGKKNGTTNPADFWAQQYEEATSGGTQFLFFKKDVTRFRPIGLGDDPWNWFRKVESNYQGTVSPKYLTFGYEIHEKGSTEVTKAAVAVFSKGAWGQLSQSQKLGYDFFTENGTAIIVMRQNSGQRISYNVMAAPVANVPIPETVLEEVKEFDWDEITEAYEKMQTSRGDSTPTATPQNAAPSIADQIVQEDKVW